MDSSKRFESNRFGSNRFEGASEISPIEPSVNPIWEWTKSRRRSLGLFVVGASIFGSLTLGVSLSLPSIYSGWDASSGWIVDTAYSIVPKLNSHHFHINGLRQLQRRDIFTRLSIQQGQTIFSIDLEELKVKLLQEPWIRQVTIKRKVPYFILIEIQEHQPIAIETSLHGQFLLNELGERMGQLPPKVLDRSFPDLWRVSGTFIGPEIQALVQAQFQFPEIMDTMYAAERLGLNGWRLWFYRPDKTTYFVSLNDDPQNMTLKVSLEHYSYIEHQYKLSKRAAYGYDLRGFPKLLISRHPNELGDIQAKK